MVLTPNKEITPEDIKRFLTESSSFSFEMQVLKLLTDAGYKCNHSGTYKDPVTGTYREFDIRATKTIQKRFVAKVAVECKAIDSPLIIHAVSRGNSEAYNEIIHSKPVNGLLNDDGIISTLNSYRFTPQSMILRWEQIDSIYGRKELVGKSMDQLKRNGANLVSDDEKIFSKMSQAFNSCADLINESFDVSSHKLFSIVPILVIPDEKLYTVEYDQNGDQRSDVTPCNHISYYCGRKYITPPYTVSHLEIVTKSHLVTFLKSFFESEASTTIFGRPDKVWSLVLEAPKFNE